MKRESPPPRERFPYLAEMTTRWLDNDVYGHVNNVAYFSYFDSTVNRFLIERGGLDTRNGPTIGVIVESKCNYAQPLAYPESLEVGVCVEHLGTRSVRYGVGVFKKGSPTAAAWGYLVHVFVGREALQPEPIPATLRLALQSIPPPA